ncbi:MAG: hypothetical protein CM15mP120_04760 [Pseudomonadota bacterium]|nr:MAG: hypothetical protein CM15mP120_04760 [Pseudomonadota bacterium]
MFHVTLSLILVIGSQYGLLQQNRLGNIGGEQYGSAKQAIGRTEGHRPHADIQGPYAAFLFAMAGAEVIKVEPVAGSGYVAQVAPKHPFICHAELE